MLGLGGGIKAMFERLNDRLPNRPIRRKLRGIGSLTLTVQAALIRVNTTDEIDCG